MDIRLGFTMGGGSDAGEVVTLQGIDLSSRRFQVSTI